MKRIIPLYIIREIVPVFFVSLLVFTFILLMGKVLQLTELVVARGVRVSTIFMLLGLTIPDFMAMTIPLSTLLAVLLTFLRMSSDHEITVLKSAGVGLYQLLPPVLLFCLWTYMLTAHLTMNLIPITNWAFRVELLELAKARADVSVRERIFNTGFQSMVIYVNQITLEDDLMNDVFIQDNRDAEISSVIVADHGRIATDSEQGALIFQLFDGVNDRIYRDLKTTETINFKRYELRLELEGELGNPDLLTKNHDEYSTDELWDFTERLRDEQHQHYPIYLMDAHLRLALPFACLILGLIAVPLGMQFRGRGRNYGVVIGMAVFLMYYVMISAAKSFGESAAIPPALGIWTPNAVGGAVTLYMLVKTNRESSFGSIALVEYLVGRLKLAGKVAQK